MKHIKMLSFLFLSLLLMGCRKDDDNNEEDTPSGYFLKAKVDGVDYLAQGEIYCNYTNILGMVVISASNSDATRLFTITSTYGLETGTYTASASQPSNLVFQYVENEVSYTTAETYEGLLEITSIDTASKTLKGKFSFKGKELNGTKVKTITAGEFQCKGLN